MLTEHAFKHIDVVVLRIAEGLAGRKLGLQFLLGIGGFNMEARTAAKDICGTAALYPTKGFRLLNTEYGLPELGLAYIHPRGGQS